MKHTILAVDDNGDDTELLTMVLQSLREDLEIQVSHGGQEALDRLLPDSGHASVFSPSISLILLDIKMPKVDGFEVLERLKANPGTRMLPVVMFTSSSEQRDLKRSYESGANGYAVKPVNFQAYQDLLRTILAYWLDVNRVPGADVAQDDLYGPASFGDAPDARARFTRGKSGEQNRM